MTFREMAGMKVNREETTSIKNIGKDEAQVNRKNGFQEEKGIKYLGIQITKENQHISNRQLHEAP